VAAKSSRLRLARVGVVEAISISLLVVVALLISASAGYVVFKLNRGAAAIGTPTAPTTKP